MDEQTKLQQRINSITAVQKYILTKEECRGRHKASIIATINGTNYYGTLTVSAKVALEYAEVIIEDLGTICNPHTNKFTTTNDVFSIINKTLQITPQNELIGSVHIEVTAK